MRALAEHPHDFVGEALPWQGRGRTFGVMGVVNATPDSFHAASRSTDLAAIEVTAQRMVREGVDVFDVGGESTRPGATPVAAEEEEARVLPVIRWMRKHVGEIPISIDTYKASVARSAVGAGAVIVNDVTGGSLDAAMPDTIAELGVHVILGHIRGTPATMRDAPEYGDVIEEVACELHERMEAFRAAGVGTERIWLDPGVGFGKRADASRRLLFGLEGLARLGRPLVIGVSRKSFLGEALQRVGIDGSSTDARLEASLAAAVLAAERGAVLLRAHDVGPTRRALAVLEGGVG